ncbi:signal recognition particle-docking protein FtsY [Pseudonocardia sp. HH130630-07]|uniref:signal recognition particle-docking protein FtsY n=1 Tax=Pseudonocardia sp. HH130630-07 TaxID=1690815 RepID=UPI0008152A44|nr:signal recognition particle-docking protein FtsY [Pseudonocardia sp. HH130630-07]ANY10236.1 hypothetical protein AFB00_20460 [Pseudonocardia sp. HH130630-07]
MTTQTIWIVVAVVVAVLLIAVVAGLLIARRRRISLREDDPQRELGTDGTATAPPKKGGSYQAGGGFDFASGTAAAPERPAADGSAPGVTEPVERPDVAPVAPVEGPTADEVRTPPGGNPVVGGATEARTPPGGLPVSTAPPVRPGTAPSSPTVPTESREPADPAVPTPADRGVIDTAEASKDPATQQLVRPPAGAPPTSAPPAPEAPAPRAPAPVPADTIDPAEGRIERLRGRLSRSRSGLGQSLLGLLGAGDLDEDSWEDVEATLLQADLGPETTAEVVEKLRHRLAARGVRTAEQVRETLREVLVEALETGQGRSVHVLPQEGRPAVVLVVGVNGTGKTTTTGKLARVLVAGGRQVTLGAADTFRAAAAEQLVTWGERSGAGVVRGPEGSDPASVAFEAVKRGTAGGADAVLLDTAGRLHTKTGLMDELGKVKRVVEKQARVDEVLLVLDATTGQNGLTQARVFGEVVDVTGIVLTKLDGTAKGGIVFRVQRELGVPVKLVGLGEGPDDLAPFEAGAFVDALLN